MKYYNKRHEQEFTKVMDQLGPTNLALIGAVYLLTAEGGLWNKCRNHVDHDTVHFDKISLGSVNSRAYTMFACARDILEGTKHLNITDLVDEQLITNKLFTILCYALALKRFGVKILQQEGEEVNDLCGTGE